MQTMNTENFEDLVAQQSGLFLIKFFSPTCAPCSTMVPVFQKLAQQNPSIGFFEVNTSLSPELAAHFGVRGVPSVAYCENREILYTFTGLTSVADMQYVIDNIDDEYFREHGEFKVVEGKKDWTFIGTLAFLVVVLLAALAMV